METVFVQGVTATGLWSVSESGSVAQWARSRVVAAVGEKSTRSAEVMMGLVGTRDLHPSLYSARRPDPLH